MAARFFTAPATCPLAFTFGAPAPGEGPIRNASKLRQRVRCTPLWQGADAASLSPVGWTIRMSGVWRLGLPPNLYLFPACSTPARASPPMAAALRLHRVEA